MKAGGRAALFDPRAWPWWVVGALAFVVGVFLRLDQLRTQTLLDDEWHAVRMLIGSDAFGIATHFGYADHSIPLTLYYRWLYDLGVLSEWQMHLPPLIAGIALLLVAPFVLRDRLPLAVRAVWTALLAISPVLVYLSRTARPYALSCLCAVLALVAFERAWSTHQRRWSVLYVVATVFAAWLHLLTIVFTLWPFVWFGVPVLRDLARAGTRAAGTRDVRRLFALAIVTVLGLAIVLVPPLVTDWQAMASKAGSDVPTLDTLYRSLLMTFGISNAWLGALLSILLALGVWQSARRSRGFTAYLVSAIVVGMAVVALARPAWVQHAQTFVRYVLPVVPLALLFVAEGLVFVVAKLRFPPAAAMAASMFVALLIVAGPIPGYSYYPNQFMGHELFQFDYDARFNPYATRLELGPVPRFYRELATRPPGSITLIEAPARLISHYLPDPWYQRIHRQNVKFAQVSPVCGDGDEIPANAGGTHFRRVGKLADLLDGATWGADYLVLRLVPWSVPPGEDLPWPDVAACADKVAAKLGAPVYRDDRIVVFTLSKS